MDWANERWCRLYKRDTTTWKLLGWQGRTVLMHLMRKADLSGRVDFVAAECSDVDAVALHTELPREVVEPGWAECLRRGVFIVDDLGILMPNYVPANETPMSDKVRQAEHRERLRLDRAQPVTKRDAPSRSVTAESRNVTESHARSRGVTPSHAPSRAVTPSDPSDPSDPSERERRVREAETTKDKSLPWQRVSRLWADAIAIDVSTIPLAYHSEHFKTIARMAKTEAELSRVLARYAADEWVQKHKPMPKHLCTSWHQHAGEKRDENPGRNRKRTPLQPHEIAAQRPEKSAEPEQAGQALRSIMGGLKAAE